MESENSKASALRFDPFELVLETGELRKSGIPVRLQPQPSKVLLLLASRAGHLVSREEIRDQIWGTDTFVDFDQGLNFCIKQIRAALGDNAEAPRYIETVPRRGYRFIAPVHPTQSGAQCAAEAAAAAARLRVLSRVLLTGAALALSLAGFLVWRGIQERPTGSSGRVLLAVLPFQNLNADPSQDYLSDGLTEEMIAQLGRLDPERLGVIARTSAMQYKNTKKGINRIARELGVDYVLEGSVRREGSRVRIVAQLIKAGDQSQILAESYERDIQEVLGLQLEVALSVAQMIRLKLTPERVAGPPKVNPEAYEACLKGRYYWRKLTREDVEIAIGYFNEAREESPDYAPAYAGLADSYYALSNMHLNPAQALAQARAAAARAVELDPTLAEARCSVALVKFYHDWDWSGAGQEFERAVQLNPGNAEIRVWYGAYLALMGRLDESKNELDRACRLDPLSVMANWTMGLPLYFGGNYDMAILQARKTVELDPNFFLAYAGLGTSYEAKREYAKAIEAFQKARQLEDSPELLAFLGRAYALSGQVDRARRILGELKSIAKKRYVSPYDLALIYAGLRQEEEVFTCLKKAFRNRAEPMVGLRFDPRFNDYRSDPRFQDLMRRMGFPD